ncbi:MAG: CoA transferase [Actinomycetia bacterium]|nr:CoA transferase [Actinomycetes bacterium]
MGDSPAPLADVTILDLGDEASALAGELLAELGADVLRVEDGAGDIFRARGGLWPAIHHAGKRSFAIDTTVDEGWAPIVEVLAGVDVVIGPLSPAPATARFLDLVRARVGTDPTLGFVEVVFRRGEPPEPVTDLTATAAGGLTWLCGESEDPPNHPAGELAWKQTSIVAAEAALALVTASRRAGRAGHIVVSVQEAVNLTTLQTANGNIHHWHGTIPSRHANPASYTTVLSRDGHWISFTIHPPNWPRFVEWAERMLGPTGLDGPQWDDLDYISANRNKVGGVVAALAAATDQSELIDEGQSRGLLVLPVNQVADVAADPHLEARDFWVEVAGPDGSVRIPGSPFRSNHGWAERRAAPALGADNGRLGVVARRSRTAGPVSPTGDHRQPLAGIRIVDFGWAIAGPLTTRLLADLGADVIKIESDNRTDPIRYIGPQPAAGGSVDTNGVFNDCNVNKRAVTLNIDTEQGRELARQLVATADIVTANYTPDRLDRWGFDQATLQQLRPGVIVANLAVMGTWGPNAGWRSYGSGLVAMGGLAAHTGFEGRTPNCLGTLHTDFTVPYFAASQILAALHHRDRTGEGSFLEMSQYESAVRLLDLETAEALNGGDGRWRAENRSAWHSPHGVYPTAGDDEWVAIACRHDADRAALESLVDGELTAWTRTSTREEIVTSLRAIGVPVSTVENLADHHAHPVMNDFWAEVDLPAGVAARVVHEPITWDGERLPLRPAPMWFEHTHDVLVDELGIDTEEFAQLLEDQVLW